MELTIPDGFLDSQFGLRFKPDPQVPLIVEGAIKAAIVEVDAHGFSEAGGDLPRGSHFLSILPQSAGIFPIRCIRRDYRLA